MAQDKAVYCGKSVFFFPLHKSHYAGSMLPGETAGSNAAHSRGGLRRKMLNSLEASSMVGRSTSHSFTQLP